MNIRVKINHQIKASQLRVIDSTGANLGVITLSDALAKAQEQGLDLRREFPVRQRHLELVLEVRKSA